MAQQTLTTEQKKAKIDELIADLARDLQETVSRIETSSPATKYHYGKYMVIIGQLANNNKTMINLISLALLKCGANPAGVSWAVRLLI